MISTLVVEKTLLLLATAVLQKTCILDMKRTFPCTIFCSDHLYELDGLSANICRRSRKY
jgi:hypothetical protein